MTGPTVAHLTTAVAVLGGGMLAGHLLAPAGPAMTGTGAGPRILFAACMLAIGAWRGRREWRVRAEWNGRPSARASEYRAAAIGATGALLLAVAGYAVAHG